MPPQFTLDDLNAMKKAGVAEVPRVELFGAGLHREGEPPFSREDVADIVRNFQEFSTGPKPRLVVTIGPGHEVTTSQPAWGRVTRLWEEPGGVLCCTFSDLPKAVADAIDLQVYFTVSAEIDPAPPFGLAGQGCTLVGVALLGRSKPQLKWLEHLKQTVRYAQSRPVQKRVTRSAVRRQPRGLRVYSEVAAMDPQTKQTLIGVITGKWPDLTADFLNTLDDSQLQALAALAAPGPAPAGSANADLQPTREQMVQDILNADPSQDQATLEAMDDPTLIDLWQQLTGQNYASRRPAAQPGPQGSPAVQPVVLPPVAAAQYAEFNRLLQHARQQFAGELVASRQRQAAHYAQQRASHAAAVRAYCQRWVQEGKITPADADEQEGVAAAKRAPNVFLDGLHASATRKYAGTSVSEFDAWVQRHESKKPGTVRYSERVKQGAGGERGDIFKKAREEVAAKLARRTPAISLEQRLGMLPLPSGR